MSVPANGMGTSGSERPWLSPLAAGVVLALLVAGLTGCYSFGEARREVKENENKVESTTNEILKEQERQKELEKDVR
ncbi:MAG: hypothetical protein JNK85_06685 [Verrucomicrobiales bacterium]|nr:hypothetical protein [Verrucomicrobiales bacterium]